MMGDAGNVFIKKLRARSWSMRNKPRCISDAPTCWVFSGPSRCQGALHRFVHLAQRDLRMACDELQPKNHRQAAAG